MINTSFKLLTSSESNEWYTPQFITDKARELMGSIDIDPASNSTSQTWINAETYFTKENDGMLRSWYGNMFMNPPYGQKNKKIDNYGADAWYKKAFKEYLKGNVTEAIIVGRGDSAGIRQLVNNCYFVMCDRIHFICPYDDKEQPVPGTNIFYLGENNQKFLELFSPLGIPLKAVSVTKSF